MTAAHISHWAGTSPRHCQGLLPEVVRRLVKANATTIASLEMPVGDAVSDEGWDGKINCSSAHHLLPDEASAWEIGTDRSAKTKAETDFNKRTRNTLGVDPASTTFVFVTPRSWPRRSAWLETKRELALWKDVRVIAANDLEIWLEDAPAVALWLARHLRIAPLTGLTDLQGWWEEWSSATTPNTTAEMLLAGRSIEAGQLQTWASQLSGELRVQADSPAEAIAFFYACVSTLPPEHAERVRSRAVVTETQEAVRFATTWQTPSLLLTTDDTASSIGLAKAKGHTTFIGVSRNLTLLGQRPLRLSRLDGSEFHNALVACGLTTEAAAQIVWESGRSIPVFRRRTVAQSPRWADPVQGRLLVPAIFCGAWDEAERPTVGIGGIPITPLRDKEVVKSFTSKNYSDITDVAKSHEGDGDPPLHKVASIWCLTSPKDAWYLIGKYAELEHFDEFGRNLKMVLTTPDPQFELPLGQEWSAWVRGKLPPYSSWLRVGLCETLSLISNFGDQIGLSIGAASGYVDDLVRNIFRDLKTWVGWASVDDVLPLIAAAAPAALLRAVEDFVRETPSEASKLLSDDSNPSLGGCRHCGLLWALERIAWRPDYLLRACLALSALANLDPGGRWSNRPASSLRDILGWIEDPYTYASVDLRLTAVDAIITSYPQQAWRLLLTTVQRHHSRIVREGPHIEDAKPTNWGPESQSDLYNYSTGLLDRLLAMAITEEVTRTIELTPNLDVLPDNHQRLIVSFIIELAATRLGADRQHLQQAIGELLMRVSDGYTERSIDANVIKQLEVAFYDLQEDDPIKLTEQWFSNQPPKLLGIKMIDWQQREEAMTRRRDQVVEALVRTLPLQQVLSISGQIERKWDFGFALAGCTSEDQDDDIMVGKCTWLDDNSELNVPSLQGYATRKYQAQGRTWLKRALEAATRNPAKDAICAFLCCILPATPETWQRVSALGTHVEEIYWTHAHGHPAPGTGPLDVEYALQKLCSVGRSAAALQVISASQGVKLPGPIVAATLSNTVMHFQRRLDQLSTMESYHVERAFDTLDLAGDVAQAELMRLEWAFLQALEDTIRGPKTLFKSLATEPQTFVQMVCLICHPTTGKSVEVDSNARLMATQAHTLLSRWTYPLPGQSGEDIGTAELHDWVSETLKLLQQVDRLEVGMDQIGKVLSKAPVDPFDKIWPHIAVRQIVDHHCNDTLEEALRIGKYNARGPSTRSLTDGGKQERDLSAKYSSSSLELQARWPRMADVLRSLSTMYDRDAHRHDTDVNLRDLRTR